MSNPARLGRICLAAALLLPLCAHAQTRAQDLSRCLRGFGGIGWKLPYRPEVRIRSCASPAGMFDTSEAVPAGGSRLELIAPLILGPDGAALPSEEAYAALQHAMFTHFDALFRRHGYRPGASDNADARSTEAGPALPYVSRASYLGPAGGPDVTLTYARVLGNTWTISIDTRGPAAPPAR